MRAFIIRPFGKKENIDFDEVEAILIKPALRLLSQKGGPIVTGSTTGEIVRQGNIREDMFRLIAIADLVIADVSIHNANVFYELGMRHALKPRHTFLIRSKTKHGFPFDLQTDQYLVYDGADPQASLAALAYALRLTVGSYGPDSPMFKLLPKLAPHRCGQLAPVPIEFLEQVEQAKRGRRRGELRLLASEVLTFEWSQDGLRAVGDAAFQLRALAEAQDTFELLRRTDSCHIHANLRLGAIYQCLALDAPRERKAELLAQSEQAIQRVIDTDSATDDRVGAYFLLASNEKARWVDELADTAATGHRVATLRSVHFKRMLAHYLMAANLDLNAPYPAINALALLKIQIAFAEFEQEEWQQLHDDEVHATAELTAVMKLACRLAATLCLALGLDDLMGPRVNRKDPWASSSRADYLLLTASDRTVCVERAYREALTDADWFTRSTTRRNLDIYKNLGLFEPAISAAISVDETMSVSSTPPQSPVKVLMFTGHMVDPPGKPKEEWRYPPSDEATARARVLIHNAVKRETASIGGQVVGIAGGACGGDILFHEVCAESGVATVLYLALPVDLFEINSVQRGGPEWIERYRILIQRLSHEVLQPSKELPEWLVDKPDYDIWIRNNLWMMSCALSTGAQDIALLALYNPDREADGPGGTAHLLAEAKSKGFKLIELDARKLLV